MGESDRRWWRRIRTVLLATAIGELVGVLAGAEENAQRPLVMGLTAGVGLVTGILLCLTPSRRPDRPAETGHSCPLTAASGPRRVQDAGNGQEDEDRTKPQINADER